MRLDQHELDEVRALLAQLKPAINGDQPADKSLLKRLYHKLQNLIPEHLRLENQVDYAREHFENDLIPGRTAEEDDLEHEQDG